MTPIQIEGIIATLRNENPDTRIIADIMHNTVKVTVSSPNYPTRTPEWPLESTSVESFEATLRSLLQLYPGLHK